MREPLTLFLSSLKLAVFWFKNKLSQYFIYLFSFYFFIVLTSFFKDNNYSFHLNSLYKDCTVLSLPVIEGTAKNPRNKTDKPVQCRAIVYSLVPFENLAVFRFTSL